MLEIEQLCSKHNCQRAKNKQEHAEFNLKASKFDLDVLKVMSHLVIVTSSCKLLELIFKSYQVVFPI
jgi:hypothetical protein